MIIRTFRYARLLLTISLVLLGLLAVPAVTFAARAGTAFVAQASIAVVSSGDVKAMPQGPSGLVRMVTRGEQIAGTVLGADGWGQLAGANIQVSHNSVVLLNPETGQILSGEAQEKFQVYQNGQKIFDGVSNGTISGQLCTAIGGVGQIVDTGDMRLVKGYGPFAGQSAQGTWTATLTALCIEYPPGSGLVVPILFGSATIDGLRYE